jgi:two-component system, chemotaxis family, chemotaxis protein CheY
MKRVLIVDDNLFMRMVIKNILTKYGCEIAGEAADGVEAVEKYQQLKPDIVTMDITMPQMNGIEAVKEIKKIDAHAKIVMLTAMGQQFVLKEAIRAGAVDFIVKPFKEEKVLECIRRL